MYILIGNFEKLIRKPITHYVKKLNYNDQIYIDILLNYTPIFHIIGVMLPIIYI